ncbi:DUF4129 domain-containing protein [Microbacteriaceae bacterium 4G12]
MKKKSHPLLGTRVLWGVMFCLLGTILTFGFVQGKHFIQHLTKAKPIPANQRLEAEWLEKERKETDSPLKSKKGDELLGASNKGGNPKQQEETEIINKISAGKGSIIKKDNWLILYISIPICLCVFYILFRRYKKKRKPKGEAIREQNNVEQDSEGVEEQIVSTEKVVVTLPTHPVRRCLVEWEASLQMDSKRKPHETLSGWLHRIGRQYEPITKIYENVRYGKQNVTDEDIFLFQQYFKKENLSD